MKVIVYQTADGGVAAVIPAAECPLTLEQIAAKDVPTGTPYKIVDDAELPTDSVFWAAWEADMSSHDGVGADYGVGSTNAVIGYNDDGTPVLRSDSGTPNLVSVTTYDASGNPIVTQIAAEA